MTDSQTARRTDRQPGKQVRSCRQTNKQAHKHGRKAGRQTVKFFNPCMHCLRYLCIDLYIFSGLFRWKENLAQKAAAAFLQRQQDTPNLQKLVYGNGEIYSGLFSTQQYTDTPFKIN